MIPRIIEAILIALATATIGLLVHKLSSKTKKGKLSELRQMKDNGEITTEEYRSARKVVLETPSYA